MTPQEIHAALVEIKKNIGPNAYISLGIDPESEAKEPIYLALYPFGITYNEGYLSIRAGNFAAALEGIRKAWSKHEAEHNRKATNKMALAVIRLTTELGECTDAALREEFDAAQIARFGADACKLADSMASKGPFSIKILRGANAA